MNFFAWCHEFFYVKRMGLKIQNKHTKRIVRGYKFNHLAINSTTTVATEPRVNPALPATAVVEFMAKWSSVYLLTVAHKVKEH